MEQQYEVRDMRKKLLFYLDIFDQDTLELLGHLGDISEHGLMILAEKPIRYNRFKKISIQLPDFDEFSHASFEVEVEIRWMKPDNNPSLQRLGCQFVNLKSDDLPIITELQDFLGFND